MDETRIAFIAFKEFEPESQRGICTFAKAATNIFKYVDYYTFPTYLWNMSKIDRKDLKSGRVFKYGNSILTNFRSNLCFVPYSKRIPTLVRTLFLPIARFFHVISIKKFIEGYQIIVIESGKGVFLYKFLLRGGGKKVIYRQSDPVITMSDKILGKYELLLMKNSVINIFVNESNKNRYNSLLNELNLQKSIVITNPFNANICNDKNPYKKAGNVVYIGMFPIDWNYIIYLVENTSIQVHIFGLIKIPKYFAKNTYPNLNLYGYIPHNELLPYIKYADCCLLPYANKPEYLINFGLTSKVLLYMYYKKAIVSTPYIHIENLRDYPIIIAKNKIDFAKVIIENLDKEVFYNIDFSNFTMEKKIEEYKNLLKEVMVVE